MAADPYTRLVLVLRIGLPLLALAILSTLFLFSSRIEPGERIPFEQAEVDERVRNQRVTGPLFSGVTTDGDRVSFHSETLITDASGNQAEEVFAQLDFVSGGRVTLEAAHGQVDIVKDVAKLRGEVLIQSTAGYTLQSDFMTGTLSRILLVSPGPVWGEGPGTTLSAATMRIDARNGSDRVELRFTGDVKLVYDPADNK